VRENEIVSRSFEFSRLVILCWRGLREKKEYDLGRQLLRAGTSIGANIQEAQSALTKKEFIAKMSISAKEARETDYWIRLLLAEGILDRNELHSKLESEIVAIQRMLTSIIKTAQSNLYG
jgi:four helix bundle protein